MILRNRSRAALTQAWEIPAAAYSKVIKPQMASVASAPESNSSR